MKLSCKLIAGSDVEHLHQIYAGFSMLHRVGEIELEQVIDPASLKNKQDPGRWNDYRFFNTTVVVNGKLTLTYDTHDWAFIDPEILAKCDLYFKRSYTNGANTKVRPLGLNMQVNSCQRDRFRLARARMYPGKDRLKTMLKAVKLGPPEVERLDNFECAPDVTLEPRILFMTRLWGPKNIESKKQSEAVEAMNAARAENIIALRKEFGPRFFGGVSVDDYSKKYFPEALIDDASLSNKRAYLDRMKTFPICVATVGLNGSNGWKLAEYVAASRAIITEPLRYQVAGDLADGKNYLSFETTDELVEKAARLLQDKDLRGEMMLANRKYYVNYLRPDALIRNTLQQAADLL